MIKYVKVYHDLIGVVDELSDTEAGRLLKAMLAYGNSGEVRALSGAERLVFTMVRAQMDRDRESYTHKVERNRENGARGGRPKKPKETEKNPLGFSETQENPTKPKKSQDKDKEKDKESYMRGCAEWLDDDEADEITEGHHQVFDRAESWGFELNTRTMDSLTELIATHGVDKLLAALDECGKHGAKTLAYLIAVLDGKPKAAPATEPRMQRLF